MNLIVGHGYLGSRVARLWQAQGKQVGVTTRSPPKLAELAAAGLQPIVCDVSDTVSLKEISASFSALETVLYSVGFDRSSKQSRREVTVGGLQNFLDALPVSIRRIVYVSTTGVYGQGDGDWIDENSPRDPIHESGRAYLEAENLLRAHQLGREAIILRLAGIYGPGRIPSAEDLRSGIPIRAAADAYLNLIHVDDAARIIVATETHPRPGSEYIVSDGHPVVRQEFYNTVSGLFHTPPPVFDETRTGPARRGNTNKRVSNARLLREVPVEIRYPTYREGLAAIAGGPM